MTVQPDYPHPTFPGYFLTPAKQNFHYEPCCQNDKSACHLNILLQPSESRYKRCQMDPKM